MSPDPGESRLVKTRQLGDRRINVVFYPGGMRQERHRHNTASFSFVVFGRYEENIGCDVHSRFTSSLICHPAGESHAVTFESDVRIVSIEFRGSADLKTASDGLQLGSCHRNELVAWLGGRLSDELGRDDSSSNLAIDGLISELLAENSRGKVLAAEKKFAAWLCKARDFVHDNFQSELSLEDVAQTAGVHPAHLSRVFRQKMGCTVGQYVRGLRFEFACRQILATDRPLSDIALEAGFADQSHFNRIFRSRMAISPFRYRKVHRS